MGDETQAADLAGMVSAKADELYQRVSRSSGLMLGKDPGQVDPDSDAFGELDAASVVHILPGGNVSAVSRLTALQLLIAHRIHGAAAAHSELMEGWASLEQLLQREADGSTDVERGDGMVEYLSDPAEISRLSAELYVSARRELRSTATGHGSAPPTRSLVITPPQAAVRRGVRFRMLYDSAFASSAAGSQIVRMSVEAGEEARIRSQLPAKLLHVDDRIALLGLTATGTDHALLVRSPQLLWLVRDWFDAMWDDPTTTDVGTNVDRELTASQRKVLHLMASEMTDDAIAQALGTSVRTVRRNVGTILDVLGVPTRFAAGAAAAKRGWI